MLYITPVGESGFHKEIANIAPDKSISHRAVIFSLLSSTPSIIHNYLLAEDTLNTLSIAKHLGLQVQELTKDSASFSLIPPKNIQEPNCVLDCGNAGTAMRLFIGLLAGIEGYFVLSGDQYLCARPMCRVANPLKEIGATIYMRKGGFAPVSILGKKLNGFDFTSPIASAQVKSAMILAALNAKESSIYRESTLTRDHTERMLQGMGAPLRIEDSSTHRLIHIEPIISPLKGIEITIPADPSSAFFFALAAAITPKSSVVLKNVLLNKTRIEAFKILQSMGTIIEYRTTHSLYEDVGDIYVEYAPLKAVHIHSNIAWLIDELPALGIAMVYAQGTSEVSNAKELRVKESDRITTLLTNLKALGITCEEKEDGYKIYGGIESIKLDSIPVLQSFGDHRIAMSFAIMGLRERICIDDTNCIATSFPNFVEILRTITTVQTRPQ